MDTNSDIYSKWLKVIQSRPQMALKQTVNMNVTNFEGPLASITFQLFWGPVEG